MPGSPSRLHALERCRACPARRRAEFFLKLSSCRWTKRSIALVEVFWPSSAWTRCVSSARLRSGSAAISANSHSACASSGERLLPARGAGAALPVASNRFFQRIAEDAPTLKRRAAPRREFPSATSSNTRRRNSSEYGRPTMAPPRIRAPIESHLVRFGNPPAHHIRFIETGQCSKSPLTERRALVSAAPSPI